MEWHGRQCKRRVGEPQMKETYIGGGINNGKLVEVGDRPGVLRKHVLLAATDVVALAPVFLHMLPGHRHRRRQRGQWHLRGYRIPSTREEVHGLVNIPWRWSGRKELEKIPSKPHMEKIRRERYYIVLGIFSMWDQQRQAGWSWWSPWRPTPRRRQRRTLWQPPPRCRRCRATSGNSKFNVIMLCMHCNEDHRGQLGWFVAKVLPRWADASTPICLRTRYFWRRYSWSITLPRTVSCRAR